MKRLALIGLSVALSLYLGALSWLYVWQKHMVLRPEEQYEAAALSAEALPHREVRFRINTGEVHAWVIPAEGSREEWVLVCGGSRGNLSHEDYWQRYEVLHKLNVNILCFDYPGFGKSQGQASEEELYAAAREAYFYLINIEQVEADKIMLLGIEAGAVAALEVAGKAPVKALILENPPTSLQDLAAQRYPLMPTRYLFKNSFNSLQRLDKVYVPKLIIGSESSQHIPAEHSRKVFEEAFEPKKLVMLRGTEREALGQERLSYQRSISNFMSEIGFK
jgi:esterase/lipase